MEVVAMLHDWESPEEVAQWDAAADRTNPVRPLQLELLVSILASVWTPGAAIVDLGSGSGLVEQQIFRRLPLARVLGIDSSTEMSKLARSRLGDHAPQFELVQLDLAALSTYTAPPAHYCAVIAVQSLHHLSAAGMQAAFDWAFALLPPGGVLLLQDRVKVESGATFSLLRTVWEEQDRLYGSAVANHEGASFAQHEETVAGRGDRPVRLEDNLQWLQDAGFHAVCLHLHGNRALVGARKPG